MTEQTITAGDVCTEIHPGVFVYSTETEKANFLYNDRFGWYEGIPYGTVYFNRVTRSALERFFCFLDEWGFAGDEPLTVKARGATCLLTSHSPELYLTSNHLGPGAWTFSYEDDVLEREVLDRVRRPDELGFEAYDEQTLVQVIRLSAYA